MSFCWESECLYIWMFVCCECEVSSVCVGSHGGGRGTLLAVSGDQRAGRHLGGGAAWWTFPPSILSCSPVVCLTPPLRVGRALKMKERECMRKAITGCALIRDLYSHLNHFQLCSSFMTSCLLSAPIEISRTFFSICSCGSIVKSIPPSLYLIILLHIQPISLTLTFTPTYIKPMYSGCCVSSLLPFSCFTSYDKYLYLYLFAVTCVIFSFIIPFLMSNMLEEAWYLRFLFSLSKTPTLLLCLW